MFQIEFSSFITTTIYLLLYRLQSHHLKAGAWIQQFLDGNATAFRLIT